MFIDKLNVITHEECGTQTSIHENDHENGYNMIQCFNSVMKIYTTFTLDICLIHRCLWKDKKKQKHSAS